MTKRDFFILLIKVFGLYSGINALFLTLPQNISFVLYEIELISIIYLLIIVSVVIGLFILLIFKSHYIVKWLKLENGFEEDRIELGNLKMIEIVKVATLIIGGSLIIQNIPLFLNLTYHAVFSNIHSQNMTFDTKWNWIISGLNIVLGYLLITNINFIIRILKLKN